MTGKEIENITEFFYSQDSKLTPQEKWNSVFQQWVDRIEEKKLLLSLFELKLWLESMEGFFSSNYLESQVFKFSTAELRNYEFHLNTFVQVNAKIINLLKELDFKKDKFLLNFEEFIVEGILEIYTSKAFPLFKDLYSPESWFSSLKSFLQNMRHICLEMIKNDVITQRTYSSVKKLYHKELTSNPIIITLLKKRFIPKMDKIFQPDISRIISSIKDRDTKRQIGIFFIFAFRIMKINNFIESNLTRNRNINLIIPLIISLKRNLENLFNFLEKLIKENLAKYLGKQQNARIAAVLKEARLEYKKIFEGELPQFFDSKKERVDRRKILKNIVIVSDMAVKELIESTAQVFDPQISGGIIFENYISRSEKAASVKSRLVSIQDKINKFISGKEKINPADILFDLNIFIETDLSFLQYKDWNEFLYFYNNLIKSNFADDFEITLRSFQTFISTLLRNPGS